MTSQEISIPFFQRKQPVNSRADLAAHIPIIQWRCQYNHITRPDCRINLVHIIFLDAWAFPPAVTAKAPLTPMNIHPGKEKLCHRMSGFLRSFRKFFHSSCCITVLARTAIQYYYFLTHNHSPFILNFFCKFRCLTAAVRLINITSVQHTRYQHFACNMPFQ